MNTTIKSIFENKNSKITFNATTQNIEIDDHAKSQSWFLRIICLTQIFYGAVTFIRSEDYRYFGLGLFLIFTTALVFSFINQSHDTEVSVNDIDYVVFRKGSTSASGSIKLKNKKRRVLYHYDLSQIDNQIELFKSHGIEIKEKSSWF